MSDLSKLRISGTDYNLKDAQARSDITALNGSLGNEALSFYLDSQISEGFDSARLEIGTLTSTGKTYSATNRVRTTYANLASSVKALSLPSAAYKVRFYGYTNYTYSENNFVGRTEYEQCGDGILNYYPNDWQYVGYLFAKNDDSDMSQTDIAYIAEHISRYKKAETDKTLTVRDKPADGKTVGDKIIKECNIIQFTDDYYIGVDGNTATAPTASSNGFRYAKVPCVPGDRFVISALGGSAPRAFAFVDGNDGVIDRAPENTELSRFILIAPLNSEYLIINDKSGENSYSVLTTKVISRTMRQATISTKLYISNESVEPNRKPFLRESSAKIAYLIDVEPFKSYRVTKGESTRFIIGGVNNLKVTADDSTDPVGKVFFRNNNKTSVTFKNGNYKYLLIQVTTSSGSLTLPDVIVEEVNNDAASMVSLPDFAIPVNTAAYHQLWSDYIVSNGTKFGKNSVCYRELLTTVHNLPVYAYFISFDTLRMLNGLDYDLENTVDGSIPFGDYCQFGTKRKVLFISGVHGDERATPIGLFQWVYNLCYNPEYKKYHCYDYYFIPLVNPTGYNANTRNNTDGININRDAVTQSSLEAKAVSEFIASQSVDMFVDFHQAWLPWESTEIPYYAFVSQANATDAEILKKVNQQVFKAGAESDDLINRYLNDTDKPQGTFVWESEPNPETFKNFAIQYSPISCTLETSQRCSYYTGNNSSGYDFTAMVCNQTFIDRFLNNMFDLVDRS